MASAQSIQKLARRAPPISTSPTIRHRSSSHAHSEYPESACRSYSETLELDLVDEQASQHPSWNPWLTPSPTKLVCVCLCRPAAWVQLSLLLYLALTSPGPRHAAEGSSHILLLRIRPKQRGRVPVDGMYAHETYSALERALADHWALVCRIRMALTVANDASGYVPSLNSIAPSSTPPFH